MAVFAGMKLDLQRAELGQGFELTPSGAMKKLSLMPASTSLLQQSNRLLVGGDVEPPLGGALFAPLGYR